MLKQEALFILQNINSFMIGISAMKELICCKIIIPDTTSI